MLGVVAARKEILLDDDVVRGLSGCGEPVVLLVGQRIFDIVELHRGNVDVRRERA